MIFGCCLMLPFIRLFVFFINITLKSTLWEVKQIFRSEIPVFYIAKGLAEIRGSILYQRQRIWGSKHYRWWKSERPLQFELWRWQRNLEWCGAWDDIERYRKRPAPSRSSRPPNSTSKSKFIDFLVRLLSANLAVGLEKRLSHKLWIVEKMRTSSNGH